MAAQGSRLGHLLGNMGEVWKLGTLGGIGPIDRYGRVVQLILLMVDDGCLDLGISKATDEHGTARASNLPSLR